MNDLAKIMREQLQALQKEYVRQLPDRAREIEAVAEKLNSGVQGQGAIDTVKDLHHLSHKLAGSGATYGFDELGTAARTLESYCVNFLENGTDDLETHLHDLTGQTGMLLSMINEACGQDKQDKQEVGATEDTEGDQDGIESKYVLLAEQDAEEAAKIVKEMATFGFKARVTKTLEELNKALGSSSPAAIIYNSAFPSEEQKEELAKILETKRAQHCPSIVISESGDMDCRLEAVRFGVDAYMVKPLSMSKLIDTLDRLTVSEDSEPFRVLVIDDDIATARYTDIILQGAGMITSVLTDPLEILDKLESFAPELILVDLYMPGCSGIELAAVVRQQDTFAGIPIVFLSGEADLDKQLGAMRFGGDDFLTKPIKGEHLVTSVKSRISRFRNLRSRMVRDALTGLLNHTTTNQFLEKELSRADRNHDVLTFVMLDIDHFKKVNDTYGHGVGDRVIKSLARLLKQRLRGTDIIGRLGGEEFGAVLPGTSGANARAVMDELRKAFGDIEHQYDEGTFKVTLSVGISEYPAEGLDTATAVREAADDALYYAKNNGRNQVVLSGVDDKK